ncbi:MAG: isoprenylcysteine carboxylmethyltransferase family protein [Thiomargarita sp.]|nr:isoprenylcysteine carboxylmethyltransferase family protein [Thiomargarita sp.]
MYHILKIKLIILLIAITIFSVIFISWGIDDIEGLLSHPARASLLLLIAFQFLILEFIPWGWIVSRLPTLPQEDNMLIAFIGTMGVLLFLMISPFSDRQNWMQLIGGDTLRYIGLFLFTIGGFFATWASIHLYKQLSIKYFNNQNDYQLITCGPFKYVRHPRDFGSILMLLGIPLVFLSSLGLVIAVFSIIGLVERISREELLLKQHFEDEWVEYMQKTSCLMPWL